MADTPSSSAASPRSDGAESQASGPADRAASTAVRYPPVAGHTIIPTDRRDCRYACTCGMPLGHTRAESVRFHRAHKVNFYTEQQVAEAFGVRRETVTTIGDSLRRSSADGRRSLGPPPGPAAPPRPRRVDAPGETPMISLGDLGWRSVFHSGCPETHFGGIVGPDGGDVHTLPDGSELAAWKCHHCGVRFFAGLDAQRFVRVVPRD